jgi:hypothetical protein
MNRRILLSLLAVAMIAAIAAEAFAASPVVWPVRRSHTNGGEFADGRPA